MQILLHLHFTLILSVIYTQNFYLVNIMMSDFIVHEKEFAENKWNVQVGENNVAPKYCIHYSFVYSTKITQLIAHISDIF